MKPNALFRALILLVLLGSLAVSARLSAATGPGITGYNLLSSQRVTRTQFDYKYSVTFSTGGQALKGVVAHVTSKSAATVIIDGEIFIGDVAANATITPPDTMTLRQDRTVAFNPADLVWSITPGGPTVQVSVSVTDPGVMGGSVSYRWKSTDGHIVDVNAPTTTWTLPAGPGLHFAYVLVSNGLGGYTERRVAVNTDSIGTPTVVPTPLTYVAPAAPAPVGNYYRSFAEGNVGELAVPLAGPELIRYAAFLPDVLVYMRDNLSGATFPAGGPAAAVRTDLRGQFVIPGLLEINPSLSYYEILSSPDGGSTWSISDQVVITENAARTSYVSDIFLKPRVVGRVRLEDDSICGMKNGFFNVEATATATLLNASLGILAGPVRLSADGDFSLPQRPGAEYVQISCEGASPAYIFLAGRVPNLYGAIDAGFTSLSGVRPPVISNMMASLSDGAPVGLFLPPPSGVPSDAVPDAERFISYKGTDSRLSACQYYKAIGAVKTCDANGNFSGAVNAEDWKRTVKIGAYATPGTPEYSATFINQMDLNLTRNHHSISYGPGNTAAYVCNHLGPPTLDSTQGEINTAIDNAVAGKDLIACVMMDHRATPGVNGGQPFTRFLIFGPSGELLPSVNLDGRREKFVPGVCVACHGGDKYAGSFPKDGTGPADIGAHFQPYDVGNFAFSDKPGLTRADQELAIYNLNMNMLQAGPTAAAQDLLAGVYPSRTKRFNTSYLPPSWVGKGYDDVYHKVYAHSCRTCHVNMPGIYNFDNFDNIRSFATNLTTCGDVTYSRQNRKWSMPNSLVTFNKFWNTKGKAEDLTKLLADFLSANGADLAAPPECKLVHVP